MNQYERSLHAEIAMRLRTAPLDAIWISPPNGVYIPARTDAERTLVARIVARMKADGMLMPGAPDLVFLWASGAGAIELKRPASKTLLGKSPAGRLSDAQELFQMRCEAAGVPYVVAHSWAEVRAALVAWGRLPATWGELQRAG